MLHGVAIALAIINGSHPEELHLSNLPLGNDGAMWPVESTRRFTLAENLIDEVVVSDHRKLGKEVIHSEAG